MEPSLRFGSLRQGGGGANTTIVAGDGTSDCTMVAWRHGRVGVTPWAEDLEEDPE
ncbi:hypothetical protein [Rhodobacter calidifons]|uniref:hypothetical protein n=1 Tax=Rhodobacter calidifons TaxID=2715277 RepID=UPI0014082BC2|nr:hypothetical protein [Rhodobacter calidifons]